jgi:hypothetical protein
LARVSTRTKETVMTTLRITVLAAALLGGALVPAGLAAQETAEPTGPDTVVYTPRRGTVTFTHGKHAQLAECASCHHESKPAKPFAGSAREKCSACHTTPATEPVTTTLRNAFHNTTENTGMCLSCHVTEAAAGKTVPAVCNDCHKLGG